MHSHWNLLWMQVPFILNFDVSTHPFGWPLTFLYKCTNDVEQHPLQTSYLYKKSNKTRTHTLHIMFSRFVVFIALKDSKNIVFLLIFYISRFPMYCCSGSCISAKRFPPESAYTQAFNFLMFTSVYMRVLTMQWNACITIRVAHFWKKIRNSTYTII